MDNKGKNIVVFDEGIVRSHTTKFRLNQNNKQRICSQKLFVCSKERFYKNVDEDNNDKIIVKHKRKIALTRVGYEH